MFLLKKNIILFIYLFYIFFCFCGKRKEYIKRFKTKKKNQTEIKVKGIQNIHTSGNFLFF